MPTIIVIAVTASMMVVELATGIWFGSMALLADSLHTASHTAALGIAAFANVYARRHADERYGFGTGKVNSLAGFTGALLLAIFALAMAWASLERLLDPVDVAFNQAILVSIHGLIVNGASVFILGHQHDHDDGRGRSHESHPHDGHHHHHDHNLRAAYLHVLADAVAPQSSGPPQSPPIFICNLFANACRTHLLISPYSP